MTLEEFYNTVMSNKDIMAAFVKASETDTLSEFAKNYGCSASNEEIRKFFLSQGGAQLQNQEGELSDDDVEKVSGGTVTFFNWISEFFIKLFGCKTESAPTAPTNNTNTSKTSNIVDFNDDIYKGRWC